MIQPLLVAHSDISGGAARATYRIHSALRSQAIDSRLAVRRKFSDDQSVYEFRRAGAHLLRPIRSRTQIALQCLQRTANPTTHSSNLVPSRWAGHFRGDVVNVHWVGAGALSIADLGRIRRPVVMTLHDMWAFCGAEHYTADDPDARWVVGYNRTNRPAGHHGLDLDRLTWQRKRRHWRPMTVVTPSRWLADCARRSALMAGWPVHVVPYPLDMDVFRPIGRSQARDRWNIPDAARVVLFGAIGGGADLRKGFDLLVEALNRLDPPANTLVIVFGQEEEPQDTPRVGIPLRWVGRIDDDEALASLYSAADVIVVPSRQDNLPQTAVEAQACGTPVVGFRTSGLPDAVEHGVSGYLAEPFDAADLSRGIASVLAQSGASPFLGEQARARAESLWSPDVVAKAYLGIYEQVLNY